MDKTNATYFRTVPTVATEGERVTMAPEGPDGLYSVYTSSLGIPYVAQKVDLVSREGFLVCGVGQILGEVIPDAGVEL